MGVVFEVVVAGVAWVVSVVVEVFVVVVLVLLLLVLVGGRDH